MQSPASPDSPPRLWHVNTVWQLGLEGQRLASHHACERFLCFSSLQDQFAAASQARSPFCFARMRITINTWGRRAGPARTRGQRLGTVTAACRQPDSLRVSLPTPQRVLSHTEGRLGGSSGLAVILTQAMLGLYGPRLPCLHHPRAENLLPSLTMRSQEPSLHDGKSGCHVIQSHPC